MGLIDAVKLLFCWCMMLVGFSLLIAPTPMPGFDRTTTGVIGFILIVVFGAFAKMLSEDTSERRRARIWSKEFQR